MLNGSKAHSLLVVYANFWLISLDHSIYSAHHTSHITKPLVETRGFLLKAAPRFELGMEVLQTSALPLGYAATQSITVPNIWSQYK